MKKNHVSVPSAPLFFPEKNEWKKDFVDLENEVTWVYWDGEWLYLSVRNGIPEDEEELKTILIDQAVNFPNRIIKNGQRVENPVQYLHELGYKSP